MATLYVRGVPDGLYERLREEASSERRSIGALAIELLDRSLPARQRDVGLDELLDTARAIRSRHDQSPVSAADLIREDRDR